MRHAFVARQDIDAAQQHAQAPVRKTGERAMAGDVDTLTQRSAQATDSPVVETAAGRVTVYVQNSTPLPAGSSVRLTWSPEAAFVVDPPKEDT
jgi:hypothetical protein